MGQYTDSQQFKVEVANQMAVSILNVGYHMSLSSHPTQHSVDATRFLNLKLYWTWCERVCV